MARFQGDVHRGSDRAAATLLMLALLIVIGLIFWNMRDAVGFSLFWTNVANALHVR